MKVHIYGRPGCVNCEKAKVYCHRQGLDYEYHVVTDPAKLEEVVGSPVRSVPQIFITEDGMTQHIGGFDELNTYFQQ